MVDKWHGPLEDCIISLNLVVMIFLNHIKVWLKEGNFVINSIFYFILKKPVIDSKIV